MCLYCIEEFEIVGGDGAMILTGISFRNTAHVHFFVTGLAKHEDMAFCFPKLHPSVQPIQI